ncbi:MULTISPECIES: type I-C CRISPR-associated protein Cas7/Csd2 [Erysipelotrichaceae]|jgi:CRISPR-associated protein Csd2|uniref:Type I-C CRISPR-associated protein Cas7/Csd2 n=2 Tax=Amedibacillus TaxID=2749846 RepID=A0A7G9GPI2_9FIRM|nr:MULTISPECIES: type I-C CRISPR-associated protein Cas7/Csd2 [Erysipelotrichaceae]QNM12714.1 type I-C CRISPR-associated protein Cas7/Csd2 [[Eubacterium] hominis]MCH4287490.1 type I-C CRISPR-associated protein Cas7/Csd2 [Amedibacillus hominis]RGB49082.1 type I-C CRISPR-associated protein Cas7/Csd2 [Absiella sp. AM22-9]RGB54141.1 type I-C CRISPR-associated protein Cas7/Csd2 [Absiella sp. AM10-20]RGB63074.1 type I-C CRISPR-associated protein Cas7/Csd2 [Absiella sp. AM09-45]
MTTLTNKIDFVVLMTVNKANPNGDPNAENTPREDFDGYGEISDVCIKRKIRNRLQDMGEEIFVQSDDRCTDGFKSLSDRFKGYEELQKAVKAKNDDEVYRLACEKWIDVRSFGQVMAFKSAGNDSSVSRGIRGPVTVREAFSVSPIETTSIQITKSVNSETKDKKSSDTMGMKHRVEFGLYVVKGSINCQLAEKTGFSEEDAEKIKQALISLFENDASSARPEGSMEVRKVYWWKHNCKSGQYSSAKVHRLVDIQLKEGVQYPKSYEDYVITVNQLDGLQMEEYEGL